MNIAPELSAYVLALESGARATKEAEDRPNYSALLADAAALLALDVAGDDRQALIQRLDRHERLRGQVWLDDSAHEASTAAWEAVFAQFRGKVA